MKELNPQITCNDDTTVSIQASEFHYCTPRNNFGPYTHVEVGFPSVAPENMLQYAEDKSNPTNTVYGYVPTSVVDTFIYLHGGIKEGQLP